MIKVVGATSSEGFQIKKSIYNFFSCIKSNHQCRKRKQKIHKVERLDLYAKDVRKYYLLSTEH